MYSDFSWECLRRNAKYINEWFKFIEGNGSKILEQSESESLSRRWGLLNYANPFDSSPENVFWSEMLSTRSIRIKINNTGNIPVSKITCSESSFSKNYIPYKNGGICLKVYNDTGYIQIFMDENDFFNLTGNKFIYFSWSERSTLSLLKFLSDEMLESSINFKKKELLRMHDLYSSGHTQKDIARLLYGEALTNLEWAGDSWLRARVRYKLKKVKKIINHDFYKYL